VGEWKNGFRHGYGIFFYSNGAKYEGMWDQNYKHGFGVFTFQDGSQYIGRFHNDKMIEYNIYGFSIPNGIKPQNERVSTGNSKAGANNKLKNTGAISKTGNQTNKIKEDFLPNETPTLKATGFTEKEEISGSGKKTSVILSKNTSNTNNNHDNNSNNSNSNSNNNIPVGNNTGNATNNNTSVNNKENFNSTGKGNLNSNIPNLNSNLEAISEQAELFNLSIMINENNKFNNNYFNNIYNSNLNINNNPNSNNTLIPNLDSNLMQNNVDTKKYDKNKENSNSNNNQKEKKESEYNIFKTLIDLSDLIECDPEIESNLHDIENSMLRHLSEMKMWYRYYNNRENQKEENASINASVMDEKVSSKDIYIDNKVSTKHIYNYKDNLNKEVLVKNISPNNNHPSSLMIEGIYSNDLAFAMELRDLWKFIRESNILSSEFSLAQFNRLFFRGPKNYIEMFMYPEEISNDKKIYDFIYLMISKAKEDFFIRYRERLFTNNITNNLFGYNNNTSSTNYNNNVYTERNNYFNMISESNIEEEQIKDFDNEGFNDNLHNKKQTILLRHFYEAIVRSAYIRYSHLNVPLHSKINSLIDTCIRTNINFKKVNRKSQMHTESSINSSVIVDMKVKSFERDLEFFLSNFETTLKKSFKILYLKSNLHPKKDDMTITYRFFWDNVIRKSDNLLILFDKPKYIELINIYHKDKMVIQENQKISKEMFIYIENLLELEFIFYEFCELIFFIAKKNLQKNNLSEGKDNYSIQIKEIEALIDLVDPIKSKDKFVYQFPKLKHHVAYENIIATQKAKEEEERRKIMEIKRIEFERKMMEIEDTNILPEFIEEEENEDDSSDYSNY